MGVLVDSLDEHEFIEHVIRCSISGTGGWAITANLDHLRRYHRDPSYRQLCQAADLIVADGRPLLWAARVKGFALPGQVAGSNLIWSLSQAAASAGRSIYLIGGVPGTAEESASILCTQYPGLRVAGSECPPFGFEHDIEYIEAMAQRLEQADPDIIYVALGSPKQEQLIARLRHHLPTAWWLGVGISFSFVCGRVKRAPRWMQISGLEWLHRLAQEPRRLAKRYLVDDLPFALLLFGHSIWTRGKQAPRARKGGTSRDPG